MPILRAYTQCKINKNDSHMHTALTHADIQPEEAKELLLLFYYSFLRSVWSPFLIVCASVCEHLFCMYLNASKSIFHLSSKQILILFFSFYEFLSFRFVSFMFNALGCKERNKQKTANDNIHIKFLFEFSMLCTYVRTYVYYYYYNPFHLLFVVLFFFLPAFCVE